MVPNSEGLQDAIELLEAKILYIECVYPANLGLLFRAINLMERLQKTQRNVFKQDDTSKLETAVEKVFTRLPRVSVLSPLACPERSRTGGREVE